MKTQSHNEWLEGDYTNEGLSARRQAPTADCTQFGPHAAITTKEECSKAGGRFLSQLFGWMVHVYPFEHAPEKIWTH